MATPVGSSCEWLPGTNDVRGSVAPYLDEAELVVICRGGNDLYAMVPSGDISAEMIQRRIADFPEQLDEILNNIFEISDAIWKENPNVDVLYILYPNYARSSAWKDTGGAYSGMIEIGLEAVLKDIRKRVSGQGDMLLADSLAIMDKLEIDDYLIDELHLNSGGHALYARMVLETLGVAGLDGPSLTGDRLYGLTEQTDREGGER